MISQIIVVDDDTIILKKAWKTLTDAGFNFNGYKYARNERL